VAPEVVQTAVVLQREHRSLSMALWCRDGEDGFRSTYLVEGKPIGGDMVRTTIRLVGGGGLSTLTTRN
jgi:hypothetical protein